MVSWSHGGTPALGGVPGRDVMDLTRLLPWRRREADSPAPLWTIHTRPRTSTIKTLAGIWAWQAHATLEAHDGRRGLLAHGEPVDLESLLMLEALLAGANIRVVIQAAPAVHGRVAGMSERIWHGVLASWTSAHEVLARPSHGLWEGPAWGRLPELPVSPGTLSVLAERRPGRSLGELIKAARIDPATVAMELSALSRLAVIDLCDGGELSATAQRVRPPQVSRDAMPVLQPARVHDPAELTRQLDHLRSQDPWVALGLGRDANLAAITQAGRDHRVGFRARAGDTPEVARLLAELRAAVERALDLLVESGLRSPRVGDADGEDSIVGAGLAGFTGGATRSETEQFSQVLLH